MIDDASCTWTTTASREAQHADHKAQAMGIPRKHVNELRNDRRSITAPTALILARVFGNSANFRLNVQRRTATIMDRSAMQSASGRPDDREQSGEGHCNQ
jgi:addiction module HigA family antidote